MTQTTANFSSETRKSEVKIKKNFFSTYSKNALQKEGQMPKEDIKG